MAEWLTLERIFYALGSLIAFILGTIKLKRYFEPPKIRIRPFFFFNKKIKNKYGQEVIPLEYECYLLNTGRDLVGELILKIGSAEIHPLSGIINLRKNKPYKAEGIENIAPTGINIKEIKTPLKVKVFFQNMKNRKYALHEVLIGEGMTNLGHSKHSL